MANLGNRITDLIGSDYQIIPSNSVDDLINSAIAEVADMLPPDILLKYAVAPYELDTSPTMVVVEGFKVLLVSRKESASSGYRECTPVSMPDFDRAKDADSIYLATKHTPVYVHNNAAGTTMIEVFPTPTDSEPVKVYRFEYPTTTQIGATTLAGLPLKVMQAIALKSSFNILNAYISDFIQDEEDSELLQMIDAQKKILLNDFQQEMSRWMEPDATPRGE